MSRFRCFAVLVVAAASRTLVAQDPIGVTKTGPGSVAAGTNVTYTVHVTNPDNTNVAANVVLTDNIPAHTTFFNATQVSGPIFTCMSPAVGAATGAIQCTIASFPVSGDSVFNFTFKVDPNAAGALGGLNNTATVTTTTAPDFTGDNTFSAPTTVTILSDVGVAKTVPLSVTAGANVTYNVTVTNPGPSDNPGVQLTDSPGAPMKFVSWTQLSGFPIGGCATPPVGGIGSVACPATYFPAGATATFQLVERIDSNVPPGFLIVNQAQVNVFALDPNPTNNNVVVSTPTVVDADLQIVKDGPATATAGSLVVYNFTATNNGPSDADLSTFTDTLPATLAFESLTQTAGPPLLCTTPAVGSSGAVTCPTLGNPPGRSYAYRLVARVRSNVPAGSAVSNVATYTLGNPMAIDTHPGNNTATVTTTIDRLADLLVTKVASAGTVAPGGNITYTVNLTNSGPSDAATVALTDVTPTGTTFVSSTTPAGFSCSAPAVGATGTINCTIATFAAGASATFTFVVKNSASNAAGTVISNTAEVSTATTESTLANNSSTANVTVSGANLAVTKSASPNPVQAGANITYTVTLSNVGNAGAHTVVLTDAVPANTTFVSESQTSGPGFSCTTPAVGATGTISCNNALLAAGATADFQIVVRVNPAATNGTTITNTANATTTDTDTNASNNTATATTTVVVGSDVSVAKSGPASVGSGGNIAYSVTVSNIGTSDALGVTLTDAVPSGATFFSESQTAGPSFTCSNPSVGGTGTTSCSIATLGVGATATFSITLTATAAAGATITNTATVSSTSADANAGNNSASASTIVAGPDLAVTKSDAPDPVTPGSNITYTITVMNNGTGGAHNVDLTDALPSGTTFVSEMQTAGPSFSCTNPAPGAGGTVDCTIALLGAATTATFQVVVQVGAGVPTGTVVSNTASASTTDSESNTVNNSATTTTTVSSTAVADLTVSKSDAPDPVSAGSTITYTITVNNGGSAAAANVSLTDVIPTNTTFASFTAPAGWTPSTPAVAGTGTVSATNPSLAAGGTATFTLVVTVGAGVPGGTTITNTASVTTSSAETSTANNSATATTTVTTVVGPPTNADVSITKTSGTGAVAPGGPITYTITVHNNGPATATGVSVSDSIPAGTTFVSATPSQGSCIGTTTVICSIGSLASAGTATITLVVTAPMTTGVVSNSASVASTSPDPTASNNTATADVSVVSNVPLLSPLLLALMALVLAATGFYMKTS